MRYIFVGVTRQEKNEGKKVFREGTLLKCMCGMTARFEKQKSALGVQ